MKVLLKTVMKLRFLTVVMAALVSACASPPVGTGADVVLSDSAELPPPTRQDLLAAGAPYLIGPYDKLQIDVFGIEDLQREVQIDASGRLSYPLIGVVEAAGFTPDELAAVIRERLAGQFVRDPQVTVNLNETVSQVITVDGEVEAPGLYPVIGRMTLMRAVATAGGTSEFARLSDVVIFREVNGQQMVGLYNLSGIRRGNYADPQVYANDVVIVSTSRTRRLFKDILQGSSLITTPIIVATRR